MRAADLRSEALTRHAACAQIFNILCEQPETVAAFLVPRARTIAARRQAGRYVRFLTLRSALARFVTAPLRAGRFFDAAGAGRFRHLMLLLRACCAEGAR